MSSKSVAIRLSTVGKSEVKNDFAEIAQAGEGTAKRLTETYEQQAAAAERAAERAAQTAAKIAAIAPQTAMQMQIASANGTNLNYQSAGPLGGDFEGSARRSALAMKELLAEQEEMERRAHSIRAAIDPLWAAQERYNKALAEARSLNAAKVLTDDALIQREQQLTRVLEEETLASQRNGVSTGQRRIAFQQLGFQANDIASGFALGTPAMTIFAQQAGQTGQAIQLLGGEAGGFAGFMASGWGTAVIVGVTVLSALIPKLFETKDGVAKATEELKKQALASEDAGKAAVAFAHTQDGVHDSLLKAEDARKKATDGLLSHAEASDIAAKNNLEFIDTNLKAAESLLTVRRAQLEAAKGTTAGFALGTDIGAGHTQALTQEVTDLEKAIAKQKSDRDHWMAELEASRADLAAEAAKRATDPVSRLNRQFDAEVAAAKKLAIANHEVNTSLTEQITAIEKRREAAIKAAQDAERDSKRKPTFGRDISEDNRADLLRAAERYQGLSEHRDKSALESLFKEANISIDPEMVKWCAAFVNSVLATQGLKGTGSLAAKSFLGFGAATDKPTAGDIVVSSHRGQDHVGFFEGFDAKGNVRLFSGNTSDRVGSSTIAKGDVLGFRRAPTAAQDYEADAKAAKEAADEVKRLLGEVGQIEDSFDPAGAAARKLAADFDKLDKAAASGAISGGRAAIDKLSLHNAGAMKALNGQDWLKMGGTTLDQSIAQLTAESEQHWKAVEESADKAGKVVIDSLDEMKQAGEGFIDAVLNPQAWKSWGSLGKTVIHEIEAELLKLAVINPLKNLLTGGKLPTLLTSLTSLFGGGGGGAGAGGLAHELGHNAAGTDYWSGGMTVVGEFGPEVANLPTGTRITPASQTRQLMAGANDNRPPVTNNFDFRGAMVTEDVLRFAMAQADGAAIRGAAGGSQMAQDTLARRNRQSLTGL